MYTLALMTAVAAWCNGYGGYVALPAQIDACRAELLECIGKATWHQDPEPCFAAQKLAK